MYRFKEGGFQIIESVGYKRFSDDLIFRKVVGYYKRGNLKSRTRTFKSLVVQA